METADGKSGLIRRIAAALRGREGAVPPLSPVLREGYRGEADRIARFRELFENQGGRFLAGPTVETLLPVLGEELRMAGVAALVFPEHDAAARSIAVSLVPFGPFTLVSPDEARDLYAPSLAGVQSAEYAIAETGSIVQTSRGRKTLLPGLVTDVHVAMLTPEIFVDRMDDGLAALSADPPRNISFLSGPSRSADIEQTTTIGAHGPRKMIAVLLTSPSPGEGRAIP